MKILDKIKICLKDKDHIIYEKELFTCEKPCWDEWGTDDNKYKFKYYFRVSKVWTLNGELYRVEIPDMSTYDKDLIKAVNRAMLHMANNSPRYYRLKETLYKQNKWKSLE